MVSTVRVPYTLYSNVYFIQKGSFFFLKVTLQGRIFKVQ